jgi:hypothetical protein
LDQPRPSLGSATTAALVAGCFLPQQWLQHVTRLNGSPNTAVDALLVKHDAAPSMEHIWYLLFLPLTPTRQRTTASWIEHTLRLRWAAPPQQLAQIHTPSSDRRPPCQIGNRCLRSPLPTIHSTQTRRCESSTRFSQFLEAHTPITIAWSSGTLMTTSATTLTPQAHLPFPLPLPTTHNNCTYN